MEAAERLVTRIRSRGGNAHLIADAVGSIQVRVFDRWTQKWVQVSARRKRVSNHWIRKEAADAKT